MKRLLILIGLLLAGCAQELPPVPSVTVFYTPVEKSTTGCVSADRVRELDGDQFIPCTQPDEEGRIRCPGIVCNKGNTYVWTHTPSETMPVVTFDSRMANDPDFKKRVTRFEYR